MDIAEARKRKKPAVRLVPLLLDQGLRARHEELAYELKVANREAGETNDVKVHDAAFALEQQLADLEQEAHDARVVFKFQALPRKEWTALVDAHQDGKPETDQFNLYTMAPVLIAKCCIDPVMTLEDAQGIWDEWSDGEVAALWTGAHRVQLDARDVIFTQTASNTTPSSERSSSTAPAGE